jgi:hypothetical protein
VLYAIFMLPLFDFEFFLAFADDNFIPKTNICKKNIDQRYGKISWEFDKVDEEIQT